MHIYIYDVHRNTAFIYDYIILYTRTACKIRDILWYEYVPIHLYSKHLEQWKQAVTTGTRPNVQDLEPPSATIGETQSSTTQTYHLINGWNLKSPICKGRSYSKPSFSDSICSSYGVYFFGFQLIPTTRNLQNALLVDSFSIIVQAAHLKKKHSLEPQKKRFQRSPL